MPNKISIRNLEIKEVPTPLLVYSFSSKGFANLPDYLTSLGKSTSSHLISLYDFHHHLNFQVPTFPAEIRIWDSGGYETKDVHDLSETGLPTAGRKPWTRDLYLQAANQIPWSNKDVVVSFDRDLPATIDEQINLGVEDFSRISGTFGKDLLIHCGDSTDPAKLARTLKPHCSQIDIVGLTEAEVARDWRRGVRFLSLFGAELDQAAGRHIPIHLFGCLDPKAIITYSLAGVEIFDGLSWLRYYLEKYSARYKREFLFDVAYDELSSSDNLLSEMMAQNVLRLEELRQELIFDSNIETKAEFNQYRFRVQQVMAHGR